MRIKIIKDVETPCYYYKVGQIFSTEKLEEHKQEPHINIYKMLIESGYAEEIVEIKNKFSIDNALFIVCNSCKFVKDRENGYYYDCENCKYYQMSNEERIEVHDEIVKLIKSK